MRSQTDWVSYSRKDIGLPTKHSVQKVSWLPITKDSKPNVAKTLYVNRTFQKIEGVQTESLEKILFERLNIKSTEVVRNLSFDYREVAKIDITCLNKLKAPYLDGMQAVAQLHNGKMIFGGFDIICIYDGYTMEVFKSSADYIFNEVFSIVIDSQDRAWIASDAGIAYYKDGKFYKSSNLNVGKVWNYWVDSNDDIYVATCTQGVYVLEKNKTKHFFKTNKVQEVLDFYQTKDGTLWYGLDNGLAKVVDGNWYEYPFGEIQGSVRSLMEFDSKLFIGTFQDGLYCLENDTIFKVDNEVLNGTSIYELQQFQDKLWVPMYGRGIIVMQENLGFYRILEKDGLVGNSTIKILQDSFGNVWATDISSGISKIRNFHFEPISYEIPDFKCRKSLLIDNVLWLFGDDGRIYRKIDDDYYKLDYAGDGYLQDGDILARELATFSNYDPSVQLYIDGAIHTYKTNENDYQGTFSIPRFGKHGEIYFTNYHEEIRLFENDSVFNLSLFEEFSDRRVKQFVNAKDRSIAIRLNNAVAFLKLDKYIIYNEDNGLLSNWIYAIIPWNDNQFCVIMDKGVQVFQEGEIIRTYPIKILSQGRECMAKAIGNNQMLLMSNDDVFVYELSSNQIKEIEIQLRKGTYLIDHLIIDDNDTIISVKKNTLCYNFDPFSKLILNAPPLLRFDTIFLNDIAMDISFLTFTQNDQFRIQLSSVSLIEGGKIQYALLKDKKIVQNGSVKDRELIFSNLLKGDYQVQIFQEANGLKSKTIELSFKVLPFWFQTWWFYLAILCFVLMVGFLFFQYRMKKAKKNEIRLELIVANKTQELIVEKQSVEKQLEEKEILLKEINHRVKNNMQMVSSLLELQAGRSNSDVAKETLKNAGARIKSLAYAHQELYLNNDYSNLVLSDYLNLLISKLLNNSGVVYDLDINNTLSVDIEKAQAVGLVLNELITNSIQHAWSEEDEKKIIVEIQKMKNGQWNLTYKDNGQGLTKDFKVENTKSLGFTLIKSFVSRQLNGTYSTENDNGFVFIILFKP